MRVEVLAREEIEEKMLMTPGDIVMMLNEMGGMRVQATSPSLGAASVRIQGMRGRYTRLLSDGLPLFGEVGGLGLLQIPPMDLGQVEVIKGVASALYGAGAMGGVVNLISRRPGDEPEREFLLNRSTRGATDAVAFLSGAAGARVERLAARRRPLAGDDRRRTTTPGRTCRAMRAPSCVRVCSGTAAAAGRSSRRRASRTRTATAARRDGRCWRDRPAVRRSARDAAVRRRRGRPDPDRRPVRGDRARGALRARATSISSARCSSAIGTTRPSARSRCAASAGRQTWVGGLGGRARRVHAARRAAVRVHVHRAGVFVQDDVRRHATCCRCQRAAGWMFTANTARSSVRASRRWRARAAGRAGSRSEPASSGRRRSPRRRRPPA